MMGSGTREDINCTLKDHKEILRRIQEIKQIEKKYPEFDISHIQPKEELIEIDEKLEEFTETIPKTVEQVKKRKTHLLKRHKKKQSVNHPLTPTVFHLRIQDEKLENIDIKKSPVKDRKKRLFKKRKESQGKGVEKEEKILKLSKIKGVLVRIRKAIPSRQKEPEEEIETND